LHTIRAGGQKSALIVREFERKDDVACPYGGDDLAVVFP
jgi:hypothetical protein